PCSPARSNAGTSPSRAPWRSTTDSSASNMRADQLSRDRRRQIVELSRARYPYTSVFQDLEDATPSLWLTPLLRVFAGSGMPASPSGAVLHAVGLSMLGPAGDWAQVGTGSANRRSKIAWMWVLQGQSGGRCSQRRRPPR